MEVLNRWRPSATQHVYLVGLIIVNVKRVTMRAVCFAIHGCSTSRFVTETRLLVW